MKKILYALLSLMLVSSAISSDELILEDVLCGWRPAASIDDDDKRIRCSNVDSIEINVRMFFSTESLEDNPLGVDFYRDAKYFNFEGSRFIENEIKRMSDIYIKNNNFEIKNVRVTKSNDVRGIPDPSSGTDMDLFVIVRVYVFQKQDKDHEVLVVYEGKSVNSKGYDRYNYNLAKFSLKNYSNEKEMFKRIASLVSENIILKSLIGSEE